MKFKNLIVRIKAGLIPIHSKQDLKDIICFCLDTYTHIDYSKLAANMQDFVNSQEFSAAYLECIRQTKEYRQAHSGTLYKILQDRHLQSQDKRLQKRHQQSQIDRNKYHAIKNRRQAYILAKNQAIHKTDYRTYTNVACVVNGMVVTGRSYADIYDEYSNR